MSWSTCWPNLARLRIPRGYNPERVLGNGGTKPWWKAWTSRWGNKHLSLQLYKYYVDWASENGIEYMTLDAGWKMEYIKELCDYARGRT